MEETTVDSALDVIGVEEIRKATELLKKYKQGKAHLEERIVQDEQWWRLRHWDLIRKQKEPNVPMPVSAWLFNAVTNKHADAMDNYPEPVVLPREQSDTDSAAVLSEILPVVLEHNEFEQVYSDNWWKKLLHGCAPYGVFWNTDKENGLGDIDIRPIDLLKLYWEPGITDIQKSRNLFIVEQVETEVLEQLYPDKGTLDGHSVDVKEYLYDENVDNSGKSVVVDWYYKKKSGGKTALHYVKFVGDTLLYASENDPEYRERGYYDHGLYPVVMDNLYPEEGMPVGFGMVAICRDPQLYIDQLSGNILESAMMGTKKRYFASSNTNVNESEFLDWQNPIVHVEGELDDRKLKEIEVRPLDGVYLSVLQMKIDEMKETASNRDVNSGSSGSGITSGAAISALQEAGNKGSRDMISASYRAYTKLIGICIELMRQFYDERRAFRVTGRTAGEASFVEFSNAGIREQVTGMDSEGNALYRKPIFDIKIRAQKRNAFSRMEQNERAKELYGMGFFAPDRAQEAMGALEMMDFEGIDQVKEYVQQGQTLLRIVQQMSEMLQMMTGREAGIMPAEQSFSPAGGTGGQSAASRYVDNAMRNQTSLQQKMAEGARA